jgi:hypothetical protein
MAEREVQSPVSVKGSKVGVSAHPAATAAGRLKHAVDHDQPKSISE